VRAERERDRQRKRETETDKRETERVKRRQTRSEDPLVGQHLELHELVHEIFSRLRAKSVHHRAGIRERLHRARQRVRQRLWITHAVDQLQERESQRRKG
jgi:hypothetical protein